MDEIVHSSQVKSLEPTSGLELALIRAHREEQAPVPHLAVNAGGEHLARGRSSRVEDLEHDESQSGHVVGLHQTYSQLLEQWRLTLQRAHRSTIWLGSGSG